MTYPKIYTLSHGWADKYYWFSSVPDGNLGLDFIDGIKNGKFTFEIDTGTTEADSHGCTMGLTFFSEKTVTVLINHSPNSFKKYQIYFTQEANIQRVYYLIDIVSEIPDVRSKDIFKEPNIAKYCKKNRIENSDLLTIGTDITPLYADFSKWDGSDVFTINNTERCLITEKIRNELNDKKNFKNLSLKEVKFLKD